MRNATGHGSRKRQLISAIYNKTGATDQSNSRPNLSVGIHIDCQISSIDAYDITALNVITTCIESYRFHDNGRYVHINVACTGGTKCNSIAVGKGASGPVVIGCIPLGVTRPVVPSQVSSRGAGWQQQCRPCCQYKNQFRGMTKPATATQALLPNSVLLQGETCFQHMMRPQNIIAGPM